MSEEYVKEILIKFCQTEMFGACDVVQWVEDNGLKFKPRDSDKEIKDRVDFFFKYVLDTYEYE
jgi:hypothetical protein